MNSLWTYVPPAPHRIPNAKFHCNALTFNPLPVKFKSLLHGQEGCIFFSGHLKLLMCQYLWVRLAPQATFKSSSFWYVRAGKGLRQNITVYNHFYKQRHKTNYKKYSPSGESNGESNNSTASQEVLRTFWDLKGHHHIHNSSQPVHILAHQSRPYLLTILFLEDPF
jgi:hypothetical protein